MAIAHKTSFDMIKQLLKVSASPSLAWLGFWLAGIPFWISCGTSVQQPVVRPPQIQGASHVGDQVCADCHQSITDVFPASPHARLIASEAPHGAAGCESCHGPASLHVQSGMASPALIHNPKRDPGTCLDCHQEIHTKLRLPNHHPVLEGLLNCVDCHDPHGRDIYNSSKGSFYASLHATCAACHQEQARAFVFEHEAMREGCTECHDPHGSIQSKLLVQGDNHLCLKCHAQVQFGNPSDMLIGKVPHGQMIQAGSCWSAGCHTQVHGSMVDPKMRY